MSSKKKKKMHLCRQPRLWDLHTNTISFINHSKPK